MHRVSLRVLVALVLIVGTLGMGPPAPETSAAACQSFIETGMVVCDPFLSYWLANGGLAQQGLPITPEFVEVSPTDGKPYTVQYFERARFEKHPENNPPYDVLLGLLGREQLAAKYPAGAPAALPYNPIGSPCVDFPETGQQVCGAFIVYWDERGGLAQQGLPLTGLFLETNPTDGKQYPTQYFERARFEYHEEYIGTEFVVLLGLLGREQFTAKYPNGIPNGGSPAPSPSAGASPIPSPSVVPSPSSSAAPSPSPRTTPSPSPSVVPSVAPSPSPRPTPSPSPGPSPLPQSNCDPSYPTVCIPPPPPDLSCSDISFRRFQVLPPDPHNFDTDHDGIGCESN